MGDSDACENFLYRFQGGPTGAARAAASAPLPSLTLSLPLRPGQRRSAGAKSKMGAALNRESSGAASGFEKGTLAMAHIRLTGAGEKPARFADKRTGHRPLSNPATPSARQLPHCAHAGPDSLDA